MYNTPDDHVTRDLREGIAKLGDLRFRVLDSAGLETEASSGSILGRTTAMIANVLVRTQFAILLIDVRSVVNLLCNFRLSFRQEMSMIDVQLGRNLSPNIAALIWC